MRVARRPINHSSSPNLTTARTSFGGKQAVSLLPRFSMVAENQEKRRCTLRPPLARTALYHVLVQPFVWANHASLRDLTMHHTPLPHLPVRTVFLYGLFRSDHASPITSPPPTGSFPKSSSCSAAPLIQTCQPLEALLQRFMGAAVTASQAETEGAVWCCTI